MISPEQWKQCPVCGQAALAESASEGVRVDCCRCGEYRLAPDLLEGKAGLVLLPPASLAAVAAVGYCESYQEVDFLMNACLADHRGFLRREGGWMYPTQITPAGWARVDELRRVGGRGTVGFVAMWFGAEVHAASAAMQRAIATAGYEPVRMDELQHNNAIDDEILARIRGSRFVVADLTRHRGGVYFEAGFALGLGLPVIWLCREDDLAQVHFDNRQYNFIAWNPDALAELERRLRHRIEATLGRGPLAPIQGGGEPREAEAR